MTSRLDADAGVHLDVPRGTGLPGAVVARSLADWPVVLAAWLLLVCAVTLLVTGVVYGDAVALGGLQRAVGAAPAADRTIVVSMPAEPGTVDELDGIVRPRLEAALAGPGGEIARVARSGSLAAAEADPDTVTELTVLASLEGIERHATLVEGVWPTAGGTPLQATLSEGAATAMGVAIGDTLRLASRLDAARTVEVAIVGTWRPEPADAFWLDDPLELDGSDSSGTYTTRGPIVVVDEDLRRAAEGQRLEVAWRAIPAIEGLRIDALDDLATAADQLAPQLRAELPVGRSPRVATGLPGLLDDVGRSVLVSRSGVLLLTIQFGVLAGYAVVLVAGMLVERRRNEIALMRSRGASSFHLVAMALAESAMLAIPAAILAPFLASAVVGLLGRVGPTASLALAGGPPIGPTAVTVAVLAALVSIVALTLPTLAATSSPAGARAASGRQARSTLPQRLGLDLALVALAGIALWQLRLYGAPLTVNARGVLGLDPLLVAAPGIGLLGGAVLALRIVPRVAELGERLLVRGSGLVGALGGRQLARRPLRYTRAALLLMLAAALGTLASAHAATWSRSQADQARFAAAADLRVVADDYLDVAAWTVGASYRAIPGVETATPVGNTALDAGRAVRSGRLLGLDPATAASVLSPPPLDAATAGPAPAELLGRLDEATPASAAVPLPGEPRRFAVTIDSAFQQHPELSDGTPLDPDAEGVSISLALQDVDGRILRSDVGLGRVVQAGERVVFGLPGDADAAVPGYPLRLIGVDLQIRAPELTVMIGSVELRGLEVSPSPVGAEADDWTRVALDPTAAGWRWQSIASDRVAAYTTTAEAPGRVSIPGQSPLYGLPGSTGLTYRLLAALPADTTLPAIANRAFLDATGALVGEDLQVTTLGQAIRVSVLAEAGLFAPLDPAVPALIVDWTALDELRFAASGRTVPPDEWWLGVDDGRVDEIAAAIRGGVTSPAEVIGRESLARALSTDPVPLGLIGVLGLGSLAAMVFAGIGFLVSSTVSTSERLGEFALLRALGLSAGQLSLWLSLENIFLLLVGLVAGSGLGLLLAWLVLPFATLTQSGAAPVPAAVVIVPWESLLPIYGAAVVLLVASVLLVRRQLPDIRISGVLRARDS